MIPHEMEAGDGVSRFHLCPAVPAATMLANMRSALARGLPEVTPCNAHGLTLSVAGGGPSLQDTYQDLDGFICGVNGSLGFILGKDIKPGASYACGVMDAGAHIADQIVADKSVRYYVASICDPAVFDKLEGCDVRLWHVSPDSTEDPEGVRAILNEFYPQGWLAIGGGCTMGLRWINLGYLLGFRKFNLHGLDSSFRKGSTHAYPDRADTKDRIEFNGYETRPNFLAQVYDFFGVLNRLSEPDHEATEVNLFGEGLLQTEWREWKERNVAKPIVCCVKVGDRYGDEYVRKLRDGVAKHLPADHNFVCFTGRPVEGVRCYPPPADLPGWFAKIGLFKLGRPLIYFDLDVVITGDLSPLLEQKQFSIIKDWWLPGFNSSVMVLTGNERKVWSLFSPEMMANLPMGDQQWITAALPDGQTFPPEWFPSYKANRCYAEAPKGAMAVIFHGTPKPHECGGWVGQTW